LLGRLQALRDADASSAVDVLVAESEEFAVPLADLARFLNLGDRETADRAASGLSVRPLDVDGERLYTSAAKWQRVAGDFDRGLRDFHASHPLAPGMDSEAARDALPFEVAPRVFRAVVERLEADGAIVREGSMLRLAGHSVRLGDHERALADRIRSLLTANPVAPPDVPGLERALGVSRSRLGEMMRILERERSVVRVSADLYFTADCIEQLARTLREQWRDREITPAAFRDVVGTTRKYAIPLLEYFDRRGVTVRRGEGRRLRQ
jgi:selenocysteine-specific elongation factor